MQSLLDADSTARNGNTPLQSLSTRARRRAALTVAEKAAHDVAASDGRVVGAFVAGSMARENPPPFADVDLRVFLSEPPIPGAYFEMRSGVPLEWKFLPWQAFRDPEQALSHPFLPDELDCAVVLYDPHHELNALLAATANRPEDETLIQARAQAILAAARDRFDRLAEDWSNARTLSLWRFRCALFWGAEAITLSRGAPTTHRRALQRLRLAADAYGDPFLYEGALNALGANNWRAETALDVIEGALRAIERLPEALSSRHPYLSRDRIELWRRGFEEMVSDGRHQEAALPLWTLVALIASADEALPSVRAVRRRLMSAFRFQDAASVEERIARLREWLAVAQLRLGVIPSGGSVWLERAMGWDASEFE